MPHEDLYAYDTVYDPPAGAGYVRQLEEHLESLENIRERVEERLVAQQAQPSPGTQTLRVRFARVMTYEVTVRTLADVDIEALEQPELEALLLNGLYDGNSLEMSSPVPPRIDLHSVEVLEVQEAVAQAPPPTVQQPRSGSYMIGVIGYEYNDQTYDVDGIASMRPQIFDTYAEAQRAWRELRAQLVRIDDRRLLDLGHAAGLGYCYAEPREIALLNGLFRMHTGEGFRPITNREDLIERGITGVDLAAWPDAAINMFLDLLDVKIAEIIAVEG